MAPKIIIAGGTGFIGKYISQQLSKMGYEVLIISRQKPHILWSETNKIKAALEDSELLINLAGKSVDCRYTEANKKLILSSRIESTKQLSEIILKCNNPPHLFLNSSSATIYRHSINEPMTEESTGIGTGFSVEVVQAWEKSFFSYALPRTRQIALRMAIVLDYGGGALSPFTTMVKFGLGGKQGKGNQMFSWIHLEDLFQIILFLIANNKISGPVNCSSPNQVSNSNFMKELRKANHVRIGIPAPAWLINLGALIIGTETELILKSRFVLPAKLLKSGFEFKYPTLDKAFEKIYN